MLAPATPSDRERSSPTSAEHRAPRFAAHWEFVLAPLVAQHPARAGPLRFRQIEYYRMPMMAYLAVDDPSALSRADFVRLGLATGAGDAGEAAALRRGAPGRLRAALLLGPLLAAQARRRAATRATSCSGLALVVVGDARQRVLSSARDRGVLAQFRHQYFLLFLIAHFQKATLLMVSDELAEALMGLDISDADSVKRFKRGIRLPTWSS